jgi:hypothetical protein
MATTQLTAYLTIPDCSGGLKNLQLVATNWSGLLFSHILALLLWQQAIRAAVNTGC